jgi:hypothetical protein
VVKRMKGCTRISGLVTAALQSVPNLIVTPQKSSGAIYNCVPPKEAYFRPPVLRPRLIVEIHKNSTLPEISREHRFALSIRRVEVAHFCGGSRKAHKVTTPDKL